jgi:hypothetical protein
MRVYAVTLRVGNRTVINIKEKTKWDVLLKNDFLVIKNME